MDKKIVEGSISAPLFTTAGVAARTKLFDRNFGIYIVCIRESFSVSICTIIMIPSVALYEYI